MSRVVAEGVTRTDARQDFTVKVDAAGLPSGRTLYYRFEVDGRASPTGRTRTLPIGDVETARFAVVSCSNHPAGYFHAYREIAARDEVDAVLHLGDYLYEYGMGEYATEHAEALGRVPDPPTECRTLDEYRRRHAQYKRDADSRAMHAAHPLIAIWDDHEIANDARPGGAQNHQPEEGTWETRREAAVRAWFEWMPVRGKPGDPIFRDFRYGNLAHVVMLDTRLYGRDAQPNAGEDSNRDSVRAALADPSRRLLGARQEEWLRERLEESAGSTWQLIGQQVKVAEMRPPDLEPVVDLDGSTYLGREELERIVANSKRQRPTFLDTWDGYPIARSDFLRDLARLAQNPVILSGDMHTAMAANLALPDSERIVGVEFMTTSVTSPGINRALPEKRPNAIRDATVRHNPHMKYLEMEHRGWLCVTLTPACCTGEWHLLDDIRTPEYHSHVARSLRVDAGKVGAGLQGPAADESLDESPGKSMGKSAGTRAAA